MQILIWFVWELTLMWLKRLLLLVVMVEKITVLEKETFHVDNVFRRKVWGFSYAVYSMEVDLEQWRISSPLISNKGISSLVLSSSDGDQVAEEKLLEWRRDKFALLFGGWFSCKYFIFSAWMYCMYQPRGVSSTANSFVKPFYPK